MDREEGEEHVGVLHAVDTGGEGLHFVLPHRNRKKKDLLNFSFTSITRNKNARGGLKTKSDRGGG